jgi:hypothetical protein
MTPFQEFRLWARRAPQGERFAAGTAAALVIAVLAYLLVPSTKAADTASLFPGAGSTTGGGTTTTTGTGGAVGSTTGVPGTTSGTAPGGTTGATLGTSTGAAQSTTGSGASGTASGSTGGTTGSTAGSTGGGKRCLSGTPTGVTASRIKVAVILVEIFGPTANSAFGIQSVAAQQSQYQAAIDEQNARGGVSCRQLVAQFFKGNPGDRNSLGRLCSDVVASKPFAVLDGGVYAQFAEVNCYAQNKIPYFGTYLLAQNLQRQYYPWLFNFNLMNSLYHDTIFALKDRGFFSSANGFKKLGFIYQTCNQSVVDGVNRSIAAAGIPSSAVNTFSLGCPAALSSPSSLQQAVLQFKQAGVTHVTTASMVGDFGNFTNAAQQQNFKPKYGLGDDSLVPLTYGNQAPNLENISGAIAITASRDGEETTPGSKPTAGTLRCDAAFKKKGIGPTYSLPTGAGNACDVLWMFVAAVEHAPALQGNALAAGLQAAGSVDFSYPQGPVDFTKPGTTFGGQTWRPLRFELSPCKCWKLLDRTFHKTYT